MNATSEHYLVELKEYFSDGRICNDCSSLLVHFSIRLAALGHAAMVLAVVERSPEAERFISLSEGLRLHLGWPAKDPAERMDGFAAQIREAIAEFAFEHETAVDPAVPGRQIQRGRTGTVFAALVLAWVISNVRQKMNLKQTEDTIFALKHTVEPHASRAWVIVEDIYGKNRGLSKDTVAPMEVNVA